MIELSKELFEELKKMAEDSLKPINVSDKDLNILFGEGIATTHIRKWTRPERRKRRKQARRAHKGTNWNTKEPKKGFKRVKINNTYQYERLTTNERISRKKIGKLVGKATPRLKK